MKKGNAAPTSYDYADEVEDVVEEVLEPRAELGKDSEKLSRQLSAVLRHDKKGKVLRRDGWALAGKVARASEAQLLDVVASNGKQRFAVGRGKKTGRLYLRANQGHSIPVEIGMEEVLDPSTVAMHGTNRGAWALIEKGGLKRMGRQHIHLAPGMPGEVVSGMRNNSSVVIVVDVAKCLEAGMRFFRSKNGVILTDGLDGTIDPKFFARVEFL